MSHVAVKDGYNHARIMAYAQHNVVTVLWLVHSSVMTAISLIMMAAQVVVK